MKKILLLGRLVISSSLFADTVATPALTTPSTTERVKAISDADMKTCTSCHGANFEKSAVGKSKIVKDMSEEEVAKALKGYKDGSYGRAMKTIMKPQVSKYSDKELEDLAKVIKTPKVETPK